mgnify:CR=1 FL=1
MNTTQPSRITVVGSGFGALSAVRELRQRDPHALITLVAPRAELHYLPGIIWIPSGLRTRQDLVVRRTNRSGPPCGAPPPTAPSCATCRGTTCSATARFARAA